MARRRVSLSTVAAAALVAALLLGAAAPASAQPAPARPGAVLQSPLAVAVAHSPATGHLFAVTTQPGDATAPGASWVTMLDARSGKILRAVSVGTGANGVVVDDRSGHAFVTAANPVRVVMLSTATGQILAQLDCAPGSGPWDTRVASQSGILYLVTDYALRVISLRTDRLLRTIPLLDQAASLAVQETLQRLAVATADPTASSPQSSVRIYDTRTWRVITTLQVAAPKSVPAPITTGEQGPDLVLVSGLPDAVATLLVVDLRNGAVRWRLPLGKTTLVDNVVVDPATQHAFVISAGDWSQARGWTAGGEVLSIDLARRRVLRRTAAGYAAFHAVLDQPVRHLVILALATAPPQQVRGPADIPHARLSVIDTRTGALGRAIRIVPVDVIEGTIVVDSATGRAYLTWTGSNSLATVETRAGVAGPTLVLAKAPRS